jgi:thiol-disulfide isomerase/thioredoxin
MEGILIAVGVLLAATAFGVYRRVTDGRIRGVSTSEPDATAAPSGSVPSGSTPSGDRLTAAEINAPLGAQATIVAFSTAFCAPCRVTRRIAEEVASMIPGVAHVEVDAEANLDLVRRLDVRRTPTVLILDSAGAVRQRAVGAPRKADLIAALGQLI